MVYDKVKASFNAPTPQLHPLPIMGLGYHWNLDFVGPLPLTIQHNKYVLVMVYQLGGRVVVHMYLCMLLSMLCVYVCM
jgi:hypothetical protein